MTPNNYANRFKGKPFDLVTYVESLEGLGFVVTACIQPDGREGISWNYPSPDPDPDLSIDLAIWLNASESNQDVLYDYLSATGRLVDFRNHETGADAA